MEAIINNPFFISFIGWILYNFARLSIAKDADDEKSQAWRFVPYFWKNWDNWVLNLLVALAVIIIGANKGSMDISAEGVEWNDLYYLLPGPISEYLLTRYKIWSKKNKEKEGQ